MNCKSLFFICLVVLFSACQKITKVDIRGHWVVDYDGPSEKKIYEFNFLADTVEWLTLDGIKEHGSYDIEEDIVKIKRFDDGFEMQIPIDNLISDTLMLFDSLVYYRDSLSIDANLEAYELIDVSSDHLLSKEEEKFMFSFIHLYKSADQKVKLRLGYKISAYEDLYLYLEFTRRIRPKKINRKIPRLLIFLGKGIQLKDLKEIYFHLTKERYLRIWLATQKEGFADYHLIPHDIYIWENEMEDYFNNYKTKLPPPPPPPPGPPREFSSKTDFISKGGIEIKINNKADFKKLDNMQLDKKYAVTINQNLSFENYFELKSEIAKWWKKDYYILATIE